MGASKGKAGKGKVAGPRAQRISARKPRKTGSKTAHDARSSSQASPVTEGLLSRLCANTDEILRHLKENTAEDRMARSRLEERLREAEERARQGGEEETRLEVLQAATTKLLGDMVRDQRETEDSNKAKTHFIANMSHEIRAPLSGILGMTELALGTQLTPEQREYLLTIAASAETVMTLIQDLSDLSKIEAGHVSLESVDFDLLTTVESALDLLALRAHQKGLELALDYGPDVPVAVKGDPTRVSQVLLNLIGNAIKFTERGEVIVQARMLPRENDGPELCFSVSDTGIGIPPGHEESIFEAFSQAQSGASSGTGLGLSISRQLVKAMGGRLWVESTAGRGSTFHFTIDLAPSSPGEPLEAMTPPPSLEGDRVLLVEDNAAHRRILAGILEGWRMTVTCAPGGEEALAMVSKELEAKGTFDLVLVDSRMPDMKGISFVGELHQLLGCATPPVFMLASRLDGGETVSWEHAGVTARLVKPIRQDQLLEALRALPARSVAGSLPIGVSPETGDVEEQAPSAGDSGQVFDPADVLCRLGGDVELLEILAEAFRSEAGEKVAEIHRVTEQADSKGLEAAAHALKGSVSLFGEGKAYILLQELEDMGRGGDMSGASHTLRLLEEQLALLIPALNRLAAEKNPS